MKEYRNGNALCTDVLEETVLKCSYYNFIVGINLKGRKIYFGQWFQMHQPRVLSFINSEPMVTKNTREAGACARSYSKMDQTPSISIKHKHMVIYFLHLDSTS